MSRFQVIISNDSNIHNKEDNIHTAITFLDNEKGTAHQFSWNPKGNPLFPGENKAFVNYDDLSPEDPSRTTESKTFNITFEQFTKGVATGVKLDATNGYQILNVGGLNCTLFSTLLLKSMDVKLGPSLGLYTNPYLVISILDKGSPDLSSYKYIPIDDQGTESVVGGKYIDAFRQNTAPLYLQWEKAIGKNEDRQYSYDEEFFYAYKEGASIGECIFRGTNAAMADVQSVAQTTLEAIDGLKLSQSTKDLMREAYEEKLVAEVEAGKSADKANVEAGKASCTVKAENEDDQEVLDGYCKEFEVDPESYQEGSRKLFTDYFDISSLPKELQQEIKKLEAEAFIDPIDSVTNPGNPADNEPSDTNHNPDENPDPNHGVTDPINPNLTDPLAGNNDGSPNSGTQPDKTLDQYNDEKIKETADNLGLEEPVVVIQPPSYDNTPKTKMWENPDGQVFEVPYNSNPYLDNGGYAYGTGGKWLSTPDYTKYPDHPAYNGGSNFNTPGLPNNNSGLPWQPGYGGNTGYPPYGYFPPVILDLDGDGVELIDLADSTASFDTDNNGIANAIGWVSKDDGLLAFDKNSDGQINQSDEVSFVSYLEGAKTDLEGLAAFDSNNDQQLSVDDELWQQFGVWQDTNQNGISEAGEFLSLGQLGIQSISLVSDQQTQQAGSNIIHGIGSFVKADGSTGELADVSLAYLSDVASDNTLNFSAVGELVQAMAGFAAANDSGGVSASTDEQPRHDLGLILTGSL